MLTLLLARQVFNKVIYEGENESDQIPNNCDEKESRGTCPRAMSCTRALVQTVAYQVKGIDGSPSRPTIPQDDLMHGIT